MRSMSLRKPETTQPWHSMYSPVVAASSNHLSHEHLAYDHNQGRCHIPTDDEFTDMTKTGFTALSSMYAWIAYTNIDHFVGAAKC